MKEKWFKGIFKYDKNSQSYTGTIDEIAEKSGLGVTHIRNHSERIGIRCKEVEMYDWETNKTHYGSLQTIAKLINSTINIVRTAVEDKGGVYKHYQMKYTGRILNEYIAEMKPPEEKLKPVIEQEVKTVEVTPMSDYWKMMFEMHTKHLEDYRKDEMNVKG